MGIFFFFYTGLLFSFSINKIIDSVTKNIVQHKTKFWNMNKINKHNSFCNITLFKNVVDIILERNANTFLVSRNTET